MARPRLTTMNFVYTTVGLAVAGGIGYYVWRTLRNRRLESSIEGQGIEATSTNENLMDLRRSTRRAGRAVKDTATQVGKTVKHGAGDVAASFEDASSSGQALVGDTSYKSTSKF